MKQKKEAVPLVNDKIRFDRVQLIAHDGENKGIVSRRDALHEARIANLDLVLIAQSGALGVPVAKILDFGKLQYKKKKQQSEAKKKQQVVHIKESKLRPKIAEHDYQTKLNQAIKFLEAGKHVKVTIMFRGREISMKRELGAALFGRVDATLQAYDFGGKSVIKNDDGRPTGNMWSCMYSLKNN